MADRVGIEIDYCATCRGVWLDRGELDKIIERSAAVAPSGAAVRDDRDVDRRSDDDRRDDRDDRKKKSKKKKKKKSAVSLLEEIFDF